jgi:hypothetical protein
VVQAVVELVARPQDAIGRKLDALGVAVALFV